MITASHGIIIVARKTANARLRRENRKKPNAYAADVAVTS